MISINLAGVEKYLHGANSMPFVVDDILVYFDDARSKSTLGVLVELAEKTQIILSTHHRRQVDQAESLITSTPVKIHEL